MNTSIQPLTSNLVWPAPPDRNQGLAVLLTGYSLRVTVYGLRVGGEGLRATGYGYGSGLGRTDGRLGVRVSADTNGAEFL